MFIIVFYGLYSVLNAISGGGGREGGGGLVAGVLGVCGACVSHPREGWRWFIGL